MTENPDFYETQNCYRITEVIQRIILMTWDKSR